MKLESTDLEILRECAQLAREAAVSFMAEDGKAAHAIGRMLEADADRFARVIRYIERFQALEPIYELTKSMRAAWIGHELAPDLVAAIRWIDPSFPEAPR